jgi:SAM-dependent methyltransferase
MTPAARDPECPLCGRRGLKTYFVIGRHRYFKCRACRLIQMNPLPEVGTGDDYTGYDLERSRAFTRLFRTPQYRRDLALIGRYKRSGRLLDIGCGTGEFLDQAEEAGFSVMGIEPSPTACRIAGARHDVRCTRFEETSWPPAGFDVVTLWSVLEHVPRPSVFLEKISAVAKDDAILALRLPAADGLLPLAAHFLYRISMGAIDRPLRLIYQLDWHYKHFYGYDAHNAGRLLQSAGYEPLCLRYDDSYDIPSLDQRMDYLPRAPVARAGFKAALSLMLEASRQLGRRDELVIIARRVQPSDRGGGGAHFAGEPDGRQVRG